MLSAANSGDTAWLLVSAVLVFLMIPSLAVFYSRSGQNTNPLSIMTSCFLVICLVTLEWFLLGYTLVFGPDHNGWIGTLANAGLQGVGEEPNLMYAGTVPQTAFMIYQGMLALIGPAILFGSLKDRIRFRSLCVFIFLWSLLVYDPVAHWLWSVGGFLRIAEAVDYAGGAVIHVTTGCTALAAAVFMRKRATSRSVGTVADSGFVALSAFALWLGWLGANAGSSWGASDIAARAIVVTQASATTAGFTWAVLDRLFRRKLTLLGPLYGVLAGLVAVTSSAGYDSLIHAICIGLAASIIGFFGLALLKARFSDDVVWEVVVLHAVCGSLGMIMRSSPVAAQLKATFAIALYSFVISILLLKTIHFVFGLHVNELPGPSET